MKRGGKREGAGRKVSESSKKMVSFRLALDVVEYLDSVHIAKSHVVETAIREYKDKYNNDKKYC